MEVLRASTCLVCNEAITGTERPERRPVPTTLNLHRDGESWVAHRTSKGFERRVEGMVHRNCLTAISVQLYGFAFA